MSADDELPLFRREEPPAPRPVLSVAELGRRLRGVVERTTRGVLVGGEVAGLKEPPSGHLYFALRDEREDALIDCVVYSRSLSPRAKSFLVDGARVIVRGTVTFWEKRGRTQLVVDGVKPAGRGALLLALEKLKKKLEAEGLFARERKRPLPAFARVIGVVTSKSGAVLSDIVKVADRRGAVRIVVAPAVVQGDAAAGSIQAAFERLQRHPEVEVIIIGRGGGSEADLLPFHDEALVRAVAARRVPVVSAVGHETDVTLLDLVADVRAATPSQAAELVVFDRRAREREVAQLAGRLRRAIAQLLGRHRQHLDVARAEMTDALRAATTQRRVALVKAERRLAAHHPARVLSTMRGALGRLAERLTRAMRQGLVARREPLVRDAARLSALSPLSVLGRGYAIVSHADGTAVRSASEVAPGERLAVRVGEGAFGVRAEPEGQDAAREP